MRAAVILLALIDMNDQGRMAAHGTGDRKVVQGPRKFYSPLKHFGETVLWPVYA